MNDYEGTFDGNNHTISGMTIITAPDTDGEVGFIANLNSGTVKNLGMIDVNINITVSDPYCVGAIAGTIVFGKIADCYSSGSISVYASDSIDYIFAGGIVGDCEALNGTAITSCHSSAVMNISIDLSSEQNQAYAGGIIGYSQYADITSCHFTGSIFAEAYTAAYAGGIIGENDSAIKACYSTGSISAEATTRTYAGGIAGDNFSSGSITACHSTGNISGKNSNNTNVGGICGENRGSVAGCYSTGTVTGDYAGGVCGYNDSGTIIACFWSVPADAEQSDIAEVGIGKEAGSSEKIDKVDGDSVTWNSAIEDMNTAIKDSGYQYKLEDGLPVLDIQS